MGLDVHSSRYLFQVNKKYGPFGKTLTIGRQGIHLTPYQQEKILGKSDPNVKYCEPVLKEKFGASSVDSIDASPYENASIIHDLNYQLEHPEKYDTVIDIGTAEHVFNTFEYMKNISNLVKTGGKIVHVVPASNYCNHGFYQFSPCFWLDYYSGIGYKVEEMYFASPANNKWWYEVDLAKTHQLNISRSPNEYLLMLTVRKTSDEPVQMKAPYQGFYNSNLWLDTPSSPLTMDTTRENLKYLLAERGLLETWRFWTEFLGKLIRRNKYQIGKKQNVKRLIHDR